MIRARMLLLTLFLFSPNALWAGAWPRAEGETFLSFSVEHNPTLPQDSPASLFVEHGLSPRLTIGLDAGGRQTDLTKAIAFLRWPLKTGAKNTLTAFELGAGFADDNIALRPGLSWGRGLSFGERSGWIAVDMRGLIYEQAEGLLEMDITLGLKPGRRSIVILQLQSGVPSASEPYARIAPSFVYETKPGYYLELGATAGLLNSDDLRIKLGVWLRF
ncbi:MAG: hypothetical protein AAFN80_13080 [Pseudomonadota bacterium]